MAPGWSFFYLLLICSSIIVNVETKDTKPLNQTHSNVYTSKPSGHETIQKPVRQWNVYATQPPRNQGHGYPGHGLSGSVTKAPPKPQVQQPSYPNSGGLSGESKPTGSHSPGYPNNGGLSGGNNIGNKPTNQHGTLYPGGGGLSGGGTKNVTMQTSPQGTLYPGGGGLSGGGTKNVTMQTSPQGTLYPGSDGLSGGGTNNVNKQPPRGTLYPGGSGLSGGRTKNVTMQTSPQGTFYPGNGGLSGRGTNNVNKQRPQGTIGGQTNNINQHQKQHTYPDTQGQSGDGYKPNNKRPPNHKNHTDIHVRNPTTTIYINHNKPTTTYIHNYRYNPPTHVYYVDHGVEVHYPTYKKKLPVYVYEYRASSSRFNILLIGLALYNLGHLSKNQEARRYHDTYTPRRYEVCKFGVKYKSIFYEEMDVDCRLMTDFIWTVKTKGLNHRQVLLPDGTLFGSQLQQVMPNQVKPNVTQVLYPNGTLSRLLLNPSYVRVDALDPRFNGKPLNVEDGMKCYMKYLDGNYYVTPEEKVVNCKVLQQYVKQSFNSANQIASSLIVIFISIVVAVINY